MKAHSTTSFLFLRLPGNIADSLRAIAAFCGAALLGLAAPAATAVLFGWVVPQTDFPTLAWLVIGLLAAAFAGGAFELVGGRYWLRVGGRAEHHWVPVAWARLVGMPLAWLRAAGPVESGARAQASHEIILRMMEWAPRLHAAIAMALANVLFLLFIDRYLAIVGLLCALGAGLALIALNLKRTRALEREFQSAETLHSATLQWVNSSDSLRLAGAWSTVRGHADALITRCLTARRDEGLGDGWRAALFAGATAIPSLILFAAVDQTDLDVGPFLAFLVAFGSLIGSLRVIADAWPVIAEVRAMARRSQPLWESPHPHPSTPRSDIHLLGGVTLDGISFRYSADSPLVLADFSMHVAPGEMVGLTGRSSSGKSTILKLIAGLETPTSGRIHLDQWDAAALDSETRQSSISVVWSRGAWYPGSLLHNIAGESDLSEDEAWHAIETAGFADEIRALPMRMHTLVAEAAANFSAGQRQRILIARALARRPKILLLDEATLSLDRPARYQLMERLGRLPITRIIVSHSPSHLASADRIISLDTSC